MDCATTGYGSIAATHANQKRTRSHDIQSIQRHNPPDHMSATNSQSAAETARSCWSGAVPCSESSLTCHDCRYCGPDRPGGMMRCDHPSWTHWDDEEMRVFAPDFSPECDSFEAKKIGQYGLGAAGAQSQGPYLGAAIRQSSQNADVDAPADNATPITPKPH